MRDLHFLLELGKALVEAGDPVDQVSHVLRKVAAAQGKPDLATVVLPTALIISLPQVGNVQTEVLPAGHTALRLDQIEDVFRITHAAERGELGAADGLARLARVRAARPPSSRAVQLAGYVVLTTGVAAVLRGGWLDVAVAAGLGALVGIMQIAAPERSTQYNAIRAVVAAFVVAATVFALGSVLPGLSLLPVLVPPLVTFLPGALLTTGVLELSTGQIIAGSGRIASGTAQLVLLGIGVVAAAQLTGVTTIALGGPVSAGAPALLAPWLGVTLFILGVSAFRGARWRSVPWLLLVAYTVYASQMLAGLFFGVAVSAFFGGVVLIPAALFAARRSTGPPMLVTLLPGFWLLVPGAIGLESVTRLLSADHIRGLEALMTTGTTMVGVVLGILLGLAVGGDITARAGARRRIGSGAVA